MKNYGFLIILILSLNPITAQIVNTQFGQVQGSMNGSVNEFLGIPFAKPPVGLLRWKAPEDPDTWAGILSTTNFSPPCPQKNFQQGGVNDTIIGEEDCLYLNVWSPQLVSASLPVMVFIHGGGNQQGSTSELNGGTEMFFGKNLSERGNVVVVTIQYRLGPLGFLVHPGLESENVDGVAGNYAVLDQILALQWIKNNIAQFGGDPSKIMVFGESAGGLNVGNLLTTPLANGLFQRAAIQSAIPILSDYTIGKDKGLSFVDSFIVTGTNAQKIDYMRTLPSDSIVKFEVPPISGGTVGMNWQAVIDGVVFFDTPFNTFESGNFNNVPLIVGSNSEEMSLSAPPTVFPFMVTALISAYIPAPYQAQATLLYPPGSSSAEAKESYIALLTDGQFTATTRRLAQCVSQNQNDSVYRYFFTHKHSIPSLEVLGSYHGMELFYVFNTWEDALLGTGPLFSEQDDSVQNGMLQYWVNFANTGNPNDGTLEPWPNYVSVTDCYLEIKATPNGTQCGLRTAESDFWDDVTGFAGCSSLLTIAPNEIEGDLLVYPNPTNGTLNFELPAEYDYFEVTVYNFVGQIVLSSINSKQIDLSLQDNGVYFVQVKSNSDILNGKIIKSE